MKKEFTSILFTVSFCGIIALPVEASGPKVPYTQEGITAISNQATVKLISIADIASSLEGQKPITVSLISMILCYLLANIFSTAKNI